MQVMQEFPFVQITVLGFRGLHVDSAASHPHFSSETARMSYWVIHNWNIGGGGAGQDPRQHALPVVN